MSTGIIVGIAAAIIVVAAVAVWLAMERRRRALRQRFGSEYDRLVEEHGSRRAAETELARRQRHLADLDIRPLSEEERARYSAQWVVIQEAFVEEPRGALNAATGLITSAMRDRGYPTEDYDQILADLSVQHADALPEFRQAHDITMRAESGSASTEDLRQAMIRYRAVFRDLVGTRGTSDGARARFGLDESPAAGGPRGEADTPGASVTDEPAAQAADEPAAQAAGEPAPQQLAPRHASRRS